MRLLFFADLHLDTPFGWARPEVARARRSAIRECLSRICALAVQSRVDALCCAGDLYEQERFTPDTAAFLREAFAALHPLPVFLAPGNHDWLGPSSLYRQVNWTDNVHLFGAARLEPVPLADGLTLWGAAHHGPANTPGFLDGFAVDRGGVHLALFHGSEQGELARQDPGKIPHAPFRAGQIAAAGLHHALVGHFHTPRDAPDHTYPGNPEPLTFGETGPRGAVLVSVDGSGEVTRSRHRVAVSQVDDVDVDLTGVTHSAEIRERVRRRLVDHFSASPGPSTSADHLAASPGPSTSADHFSASPGTSTSADPLAPWPRAAGAVRVTLHGEVGLDVDLSLADLDGVVPRVEVVPRLGAVTVGYDLDSIAAEPTVRGLFVRDVRAAVDLTDEQRRKVLITGLRALDERRREDLEVR